MYWHGKPCYGFGLGAASYVLGRRVSRPATMPKYIKVRKSLNHAFFPCASYVLGRRVSRPATMPKYNKVRKSLNHEFFPCASELWRGVSRPATMPRYIQVRRLLNHAFPPNHARVHPGESLLLLSLLLFLRLATESHAQSMPKYIQVSVSFYFLLILTREIVAETRLIFPRLPHMCKVSTRLHGLP